MLLCPVCGRIEESTSEGFFDMEEGIVLKDPETAECRQNGHVLDDDVVNLFRPNTNKHCNAEEVIVGVTNVRLLYKYLQTNHCRADRQAHFVTLSQQLPRRSQC